MTGFKRMFVNMFVGGGGGGVGRNIFIQLFHACLVNSQNYATRCRGQLKALLPEAARPRSIVHLAVHGTEGHRFDYSAKLA